MLAPALERREALVVAEAEQGRARAARPTRPTSRSRPTGCRRSGTCRAAPNRDARAQPRLLVAEVRGGRRQRRHHLQHRLEQVDVDHLTLAGAVAVAQRDHHRERARERGHLVGERDRRQQRRAVGFAVDRREAAHRLGHRREARSRRVRTVLTEPGDPQHDQARIARRTARPARGRGARACPAGSSRSARRPGRRAP